MLVPPKWDNMWLKSQHCSKSITNELMPSILTQKLMEDLRTNCCSSDKAVQLEALKCWGIWIHNQNPDAWKLNTVCFTAVRPFITKKLHPLHKDVEIFKMRLSLMWALVAKVQNVMQLEGPQYIMEVFFEYCLTWLNSITGDGCENDISLLIFQLLLALFKTDENLTGLDKELFPPLLNDIFSSKKVFHRLADKFLNIFVHWKKVQDKSVILKLWKYFLEFCEVSNDQIPIPVWHKIFKLASQICSEKNEPIKERLAFLHCCATTLNSILTSSKFIDVGNLWTTPCEALLKKLVELCTTECDEFYDSEMFFHSKEICEVLSSKSVTLGGYDLCISALDVLEEFWLRSLFWGVWCGLVYCYKIQLSNLDKNSFTKTQTKFYRKLRGVAINFELDRNNLNEDCINEVVKNINVLNITCLNTFPSDTEDFVKNEEQIEGKSKNENYQYLNPFSLPALLTNSASDQTVEMTPKLICGTYSSVALNPRAKIVPKKTVNVNFDLIKDILKAIEGKFTEPVFNCPFSSQFFTSEATHSISVINSSNTSLQINITVDEKEENLIVPCFKEKIPPTLFKFTHVKKNPENAVVRYQRHKKPNDEMISTRQTRSKIRAEEEQKKKKRKSFEVRVQEIVEKNKERKTEKNNKKSTSFVELHSEWKNKKTAVKTENQVTITKNKKVSQPKPKNVDSKTKNVDSKTKNVYSKTKNVDSKTKNVDSKTKNVDSKTKNVDSKTKNVDSKTQKKKAKKADGKLENYFKVISTKAGSEVKKEKPQKGKNKKEKTRESSCCKLVKDEGERNGEMGWKQTSLKTMMKQKRKAVKVKRTRNKINVTEEKLKVKGNKKETGSPITKLSPFKEVFHDHEYGKMNYQEFERYEETLRIKQERAKEMKNPENKSLNLESKKFLETKNVECQKRKKSDLRENVKVAKKNPVFLQKKNHKKSKHLEVKEEDLFLEKVSFQKTTEVIDFEPRLHPLNRKDFFKRSYNKPKQEESKCFEPNTPNSQALNDDSRQERLEEFSDIELTPDRRGKKRVLVLENPKPDKKFKLDDDVFQDLIAIRGENWEENQPEIISPTETEKIEAPVLKNDESPKVVNRMKSSRGLRIIALVPESTIGSQMQRESPSRVDVLKNKKAPNVDKNSRASKMLALLSENVVEMDEVDNVIMEEVHSSDLVSTSNAKTLVSSLKSPKSLRKKRSIRFDDAKNETVVYQTDTPPCQVLEEKEKCRRVRHTGMMVDFY